MNAIGNPSSRSLVIIGMPAAGKSSVGRHLAARLSLPFVDSDTEVERAAGMTIAQIFERLGETAFRDGERRVIARLLDGPRIVLATGGGAFMDELTRALIREKAVSIWLRADAALLRERLARTTHRPLLQTNDPERTLQGLLVEREPVYADANVVVTTDPRPVKETVERVRAALEANGFL